MIITRIFRNKNKKTRFSIFLEERYAFSISEENLIKFKLKEGQDITDAKLEFLASEEEKTNAMNSAWGMLKRRSRSEKEIADKLKFNKVSGNSIAFVLARLKELGYIDDAKFARERVNYLQQKGKGPALVKIELKKTGINPEVISDLFTGTEYSKAGEIELIADLALSRLKRMSKLDPKTASRRLMGFLSRRGFEIDDIKEALKKAQIELKGETDQ